jgi:hypothetical protein
MEMKRNKAKKAQRGSLDAAVTDFMSMVLGDKLRIGKLVSEVLDLRKALREYQAQGNTTERTQLLEAIAVRDKNIAGLNKMLERLRG